MDSIKLETLVHVSEGGAWLPLTLTYDPSDPFAVTLTFHDVRGDVEWVVSRDMIDTGLCAGFEDAQGNGDFTIFVCHGCDMLPGVDTVHMTLGHPDDGYANIHASVADFSEFLADAFNAVPLGMERMDMDNVIAKLLAS